LRYQGSTAAGRNFVINGGFDIWQRGTSFVGANSNTYTADRWNMFFNPTPTAYTISRQTSGLTGFPYALRVQRNNGATDTTGGAIGTSIEIANATLLAGQTVNVSFYARKGALFSQPSSLIVASFKTGTGSTDQNGIYNTYTGQVGVFSENATLTTSWQRFTYTATLNSDVTQAALQFNAGADGTAGATDYYELAGVQISVGSVATQFSRAGGTIQGELAACQRYYFRRTAEGTNSVLSEFGGALSTTSCRITVTPPVQMRVIPTATDYTALTLYDAALASASATGVTINSGLSNKSLIYIAVDSSSLTQYRDYQIISSSSSGFLAFSAEL
jgi:hypothetical protein